jgi:hypothetical protein
MSEWLPIETAPKDGTKIFAYCEPRHESGRSMEFKYFGVVWWRGEKFSESRWQWRHALNDSAAEPTHWMPLPEQPH